MDEAPPDMVVTQDHEGVTWAYGTHPEAAVLGAAVALTFDLAAVVSRAALGGSGIALACLAVAGIAAFVAASALRSFTVRLTTRTITLGTHSLFGATTRAMLRLDDVRRIVAAQTKHGDWGVVLHGKTETTVIGSAQPESHVVWFVGAARRAKGASEDREHVEGREWTFLRTAPEAIVALEARGGQGVGAEPAPSPDHNAVITSSTSRSTS